MRCEARRRQQLFDRIHRRFDTVTEWLEIGSLRFPFTRVTDPDVVLDQVAAAVDLQERLYGRASGQPMHLPYWAELWDSAMGIARHLVWEGSGFGVQGSGNADDSAVVGSASADARGAQWQGVLLKAPTAQSCGSASAKADPTCSAHSPTQSSVLSPQSSSANPPPSVLDLGCGMGLSGTVAAGLGARVLFADLEPPALLFAQLNSLPWRQRVRTRQLDWQRDRLDERFNLILGADILYEKAQWPFLEPFWRAHLAPGGSVLLGEPGRGTGDQFISWIAERGWLLDQFEQPVATRPRPIRLFQIRPKEPAPSI